MRVAETVSPQLLVKTELPPLPGSVVRLTRMLNDMSVSQRTIANAISVDPIIAARVLRLANSVTYSPEQPITNLPAAISTIGNIAISETLMVSGISDAFGRRILASEAGQYIWRHSIATAMAASDMCQLAGLRGSEEAFLCGLLHDIGQLILLRADFPLYSEVLETGRASGDLSAAEREVFGFDHATLSSVAAEQWNLPPAISTMISCHHAPATATSAIAITRILYLADALVDMKMEGLEIDDLLASESAIGFGFSQSQFEALWEDVESRVSEITQAVA